MGEPKKQEQPAEATPATPMVKIRLLRACMVGTEILNGGTEVEVDEKTAKELCDTKFDGYHRTYGYVPEILLEEGESNPLAKQKIVRAVRI